MGLDIRLYTGLKKIEGAEYNEDDELKLPDGTTLDWDDYIKIYQDPYFATLNRHEGVEVGAFYTIEGGEHVFSRSYGSYGGFREWLARIAGYQAIEFSQYGVKRPSYAACCWDDVEGGGQTGPFSELINFSDCEGTLGPVVCAKLAKDFQQFAAKAANEADRETMGHPTQHLDFQSYLAIGNACKRAGEENGVLVFQ
jgi:hypothetical protein